MTENEQTILVVGTGNTLRSDDGIGAYICTGIDALGLKGVKTLFVQQLQTELLEEFLQYTHIILADAAVSGEAVGFYQPGSMEKVISSSHHMNAGLFVVLAQRLYEKKISLWVCSVKGEQFGIGEKLSPTAKRNGEAAIRMIAEWIQGGCQ